MFFKFLRIFRSRHWTSLGGCSHYMLIVKCCSFFSVLFRNTHCAKYYLVAAPIICYLWNTKCLENYWTTEAVVRRRFVKKVFLKISKNPQENTCVRVPFLVKVQVKDWSLIKKKLQHSCFPVKYATCILQNISSGIKSSQTKSFFANDLLLYNWLIT